MTKSFYLTPEWKKVKAKALAINKRRNNGKLVCAICKFVITERPNVDHIKRMKDYPTLALDINNLQVLHQGCHSRLKQLVEANVNKVKITDQGFPEGSEWDM